LKLTQTAYIISLKFAPGLKKEFEVLGENIRKRGIDVKYFLSERYKKLGENCEGVEYITKDDSLKGMIFETVKFVSNNEIVKIFQGQFPLFICFYNPHPLNPFIARKVKNNFSEAMLALYLHDPYKPDKTPYGVLKATYIAFVEFIQGLTVKCMDYVISPSEYSSHLFKRKYPNFRGGNYIAPLSVPDQKISENKVRKYFSIVGGAHQATGHDTFVDLVNYVAEKGLNYEFALISSSNISSYLRKLSEGARRIVKIINKKIINDSEIDEVIRESYAVFRLDREVTQSGVVPVAYMNETPIIARDIIGLKQHITHGENGYIAPFNCTPENLIDGMDFVKARFIELSKNARKSYEDVWAEWNFDKYYDWLIKLLNK
jgi:glycosyltransferase involved in cell wall biosynthesis